MPPKFDPQNPPLGWISPALRSKVQQDAHRLAVQSHVRFALTPPTLPKGAKVILTDVWSADLVKQDTGTVFTGFHQLTGSCVGASAGNAVATLNMVQRLLADTPTKAFIPWWPFDYGRTRSNEGDHGQGEGAMDSVMGETMAKEGVLGITESPGLPAYTTDDGFYLTSQIEMTWSDGEASVVKAVASIAKAHPVGSVATLSDVGGIKAAVVNGYPVLDGCDLYVGHGTIKGSGDNAYVSGGFDGRGGHSTCVLGYWEHPTDGPQYLYSNQWPTSTYPKDPAGAGRCCVWISEKEMARLFGLGGSGGETMALSHLSYFPAQPEVLNWYL